jgi:hypothetical protein
MKSQLPYVSACIERSGDALLDVELDLRRLLSREGSFNVEMKRVAVSLPDEDKIDVVLETINDIRPFHPRPFRQHHAAIQLLIGKDDSSLKRCAHFNCNFLTTLRHGLYGRHSPGI